MAPTYLVALTQKQKEQAGKERKEGRANGTEESEVKVEDNEVKGNDYRIDYEEKGSVSVSQRLCYEKVAVLNTALGSIRDVLSECKSCCVICVWVKSISIANGC